MYAQKLQSIQAQDNRDKFESFRGKTFGYRKYIIDDDDAEINNDVTDDFCILLGKEKQNLFVQVKLCSMFDDNVYL